MSNATKPEHPQRKRRTNTAQVVPASLKDPNFLNFLTVRQGASLVGVSPSTIKQLLWKRKLRRYKFFGRTLVSRDQLLAMVREAE